MTSKFADRQFWIDTFDRAASSFAQGLIGALALDQIGVLDVDWAQGLSLAGSYTVLSVLQAVAFRGTPDKPVAYVAVNAQTDWAQDAIEKTRNTPRA